MEVTERRQALLPVHAYHQFSTQNGLMQQLELTLLRNQQIDKTRQPMPAAVDANYA